jgi:hypothetical protein
VAPITNEDRAREWLSETMACDITDRVQRFATMDPIYASLAALLDERERAGEARGIERASGWALRLEHACEAAKIFTWPDPDQSAQIYLWDTADRVAKDIRALAPGEK